MASGRARDRHSAPACRAGTGRRRPPSTPRACSSAAQYPVPAPPSTSGAYPGEDIEGFLGRDRPREDGRQLSSALRQIEHLGQSVWQSPLRWARDDPRGIESVSAPVRRWSRQDPDQIQVRILTGPQLPLPAHRPEASLIALEATETLFPLIDRRDEGAAQVRADGPRESRREAIVSPSLRRPATVMRASHFERRGNLLPWATCRHRSGPIGQTVLPHTPQMGCPSTSTRFPALRRGRMSPAWSAARGISTEKRAAIVRGPVPASERQDRARRGCSYFTFRTPAS